VSDLTTYIHTDMILCIETSTTRCSVAIGWGTEVIAQRAIEAPEGGHASALAPMVEEVLQELKARDLSLRAIAVSAGPGSYTGLRIATSLAKGLCLGLQLPLIAVDTLELLARGAIVQLPEGSPVTIVPMLDARRMEVYTAQFTAEGRRLTEDAPLILDEQASPLQQGKYILVGNGATKARGLWPERDYEVWDEGFAPEASVMTPLATAHYEAKDFVDTAYWTPNYLKEYVAVIAKNKVLGR